MSNFGADIFDHEPQPAPGDGEDKPAVGGEDADAETQKPVPAARKKATRKKAPAKRRASATTASDTAAGDTTAGDTTAGDTAAGDTAAGDTAAGDTTAGDTAAGDTAAGDSDRPARGDQDAPDAGHQADEPIEEQPPGDAEPATRPRRATRSRRQAPEDESDAAASPRRSRRSSRTTTVKAQSGGRGRAAKTDRTPARDPGRSARSRPKTPPAAPRTSRVGILIDFDALQDQAHEAGGELAFLKLIKLLTGDRTLCQAFYYTDEHSAAGLPPPSSTRSLTLRSCPDRESVSVAMAIDAMGMIDELDALVLAPMKPNLEPLLEAMEQRGISVEVAGFAGEAPAGTRPHRLGNSCLFVP